MMSCGTSSGYVSCLLLKTADFPIRCDLLIQKSCSEVLEIRAMRRQLPLRTRRGSRYGRLLCGLFKCPQHDVATRHGSVERLLGGFLTGKSSLHFLGPDNAHLNYHSATQPARSLGRPLVGEFLEGRLQDRVLLVEAVRPGCHVGVPCDRPVA